LSRACFFMRRSWIRLTPYAFAALLAACSSPPQQHARMGASGGAPADAYRTRPSLNFVDHSVGQEEVSIQAMSLVGVPYRWGGNTPDSGFDCSGLVRYVLARSASMDLPRTTGEMSLRGSPTDPDQIAPGDLIFFNTTGRPHSHVGIYVGKMRFVNAPSTGGTVRIDYVTNPYWAKRFDGIRRVAPGRGAPSTPFDAPTLIATPSTPPAATTATATAAAAAAAAATSTTTTATTAPMRPSGTEPVAAAPSTQAAFAPRAATPGQDAFEPPPPTMSAAQAQARAPAAPQQPTPANDGSTAISGTSASGTVASGTGVDTAGNGVGTAAGASPPPPAQSAAADDPIARFASGKF
jgi:hypothetical protein